MRLCLFLLLCFFLGDARADFNCTEAGVVSNCSFRGVCYPSSGQCVCNEGYTSFPKSNQLQGPQCNYKQKSRLVPFILHIIVGWCTGLGSFLLAEYAYGAAQLVTFWCAVACIPCVFHVMELGIVLVFCTGSAAAGVWITVLVKIGTADFSDANGAPLSPAWF